MSGNTIFNVLQMSELEADNDERPLEPPSIKSAEILNNPFDDIIPRITTGEVSCGILNNPFDDVIHRITTGR